MDKQQVNEAANDRPGTLFVRTQLDCAQAESSATPDDVDHEFDESIACDLDDSVVRANAIQLLEALKSGDRMHIFEAAMNMTTADATCLRHQIYKYRTQPTSIDETVLEAAEFAAAIIEKNAIAHA